MHFLNTVVETYTRIYLCNISAVKIRKTLETNSKKVHMYKFTTSPHGNFWIEKAGIPREHGRPDDAALWLFPE
jgi:hypothetical protein